MIIIGYLDERWQIAFALLAVLFIAAALTDRSDTATRVSAFVMALVYLGIAWLIRRHSHPQKTQ